MAWNPSPDVAALRDFAVQFDRPIVVTFSLSADAERFHITTYGTTKQLCTLAGSFGDQLAQAIASGTIAAPELAPEQEPPATQVWRREQ